MATVAAGSSRPSSTNAQVEFRFLTRTPKSIPKNPVRNVSGTQCNFTLDDTFTAEVVFLAPPNGDTVTLVTSNVTHTNLATGYSLSEVDHINTVAKSLSSTVMQVGIFWHLRDPSGHVVLVKARQAILDTATGNVISFTPNSGFDQTYAQIICPALGGSPA